MVFRNTLRKTNARRGDRHRSKYRTIRRRKSRKTKKNTKKRKTNRNKNRKRGGSKIEYHDGGQIEYYNEDHYMATKYTRYYDRKKSSILHSNPGGTNDVFDNTQLKDDTGALLKLLEAASKHSNTGKISVEEDDIGGITGRFRYSDLISEIKKKSGKTE